MKRLLTGCPICGGELTKTCEKINYGEITSSFYCTKKDCYFSTNTDWVGEYPYEYIEIDLDDGKLYWEDGRD